MASSSQQQQKLKYEDIHRLIYMYENIFFEQVPLHNHPDVFIHYVRKSNIKGNPLPHLSQLPLEVPDFLEKLNADVVWCIRILDSLKSLTLKGYGGADVKCRAFVEAMKLNRPESVLQELRGPGWALMDAAASLSSLQRCTLDLGSPVENRQSRMERFVAALEGSNIWHLGIINLKLAQDGFSESWRSFFTKLCRSSRLRSLTLRRHAEASDFFLNVAVEEGFPCNLQHLELTWKSWDITGEKLGKALQKTHHGESKAAALTSFNAYQRYGGNMDAILCVRHGLSSLSIEIEEYREKKPVSTTEFLQLLEASSCKLQHLHVLEAARMSLLPHRKDQLRLVDFLDRHIDCPLETTEGLEWADESLQSTCIEILKRNKVYREGGLLTRQMPPSTAKLFICGDSGVGKSTLRRNLTRRVYVPACVQNSPASTVGIRLAALRFGKKTLVLCDLAGQPEFHTLHHYFMRGSDKDLFLVVCKAPSATDDPKFVESQLRYWLRFIAAHRSLSEQKPRVLILLNHFPNSERRSPGLICEHVMREYSGEVDFGRGESGVYGFSFKSFQEVQKLKPALGAALTGLIESRPKVPELCTRIIQEMNSRRRPRIMSMKGFQSLYGMRGLHKQHLRACITYLHDAGEVVYLASDEDMEPFIIVDVQWFLQELIGEFLPRLPKKGAGSRLPSSISGSGSGSGSGSSLYFHPIQPVVALKAKIATLCDHEDHVDYILSCLDKLGVTLTEVDPGNSRESKVTILPLMQNAGVYWCQEAFDTGNSSYTFWGRRFDCKDSDRRLLPFGIFNMLQVKLSGAFSKTDIGKGWLYLVENRIHIIVKIGGTRGEWYDKHWVDVLVRVPFDPDDYFLETGEKLFHQVRTVLFELCGAINWGCPSLELEEKVLSPRFVERGPGVDFPNVHQLSKVLEKIEEKGMRYFYTWPFEDETTQAFQLLFPGERDAYFSKQRGALNSIHLEVEECLVAEPSSDVQHELMKMKTNVKDNLLMLSEDGRIISQQIKRSESFIVKELKASEARITNEIHRLELVVKKQMENIQQQGITIFSKLQLHLEFEAPKYPFLTNEDNFLQRASSLTFGSTSRLHFLCEHRQGCHAVEGQTGIKIRTPPDWLKKFAPVLVPTLRILFFALKIAAIAGFGVVIPTPHSAFPKGLKDKTIDGVCEEVFGNLDQRLQSLTPSRNDLERFHSSLTEFLKGKNLGQELGLFQSLQNGQRLWLCLKHHS